MILRGVLDQSLGGFVCVRGFARMGELARASYADEDYQRKLIETQTSRIVDFLRDRTNLFFPEVVLSCLIEYDYMKRNASATVSPLKDVLSGKGFKSNRNGIAVQVKVSSYAGQQDARAASVLKLATIKIPDELLDKQKPPLFRIDGNHRLSAADQNPDEFNELVTPFALLLFEESDADRRHSKTIFHNINSKSQPLTSEENYRVILDDPELFSDDELLEPSLGWPFLLARHAMPAVEPAAVPGLKSLVRERRTLLIDLFTILLGRNAIDQSLQALPDVQQCLTRVHEIYNAEPSLRENACPGLFVAFMYYCVLDAQEGRLESFRKWVSGNHLAAIKTIDATAIIDIFDRVFEAKRRTVFVSMEFGEKTKATFDAIKKTIERINETCKPEIKIEPLRVDELNPGFSYSITEEILKAIETTGLLVADLTFGNKNVYHEIGYLMGLNKGRQSSNDNFILIVRERGHDEVEADVSFNLKGISQIRYKEMTDLEERLTETIKTYYGLA